MVIQRCGVGVDAVTNGVQVSRICLHRVCLLLNVELDRIHAVWGSIQTVESKSETDYCELILLNKRVISNLLTKKFLDAATLKSTGAYKYSMCGVHVKKL